MPHKKRREKNPNTTLKSKQITGEDNNKKKEFLKELPKK